MKTRNLILTLAGALVLGVVSMAIFAALVEYRVGQPIPFEAPPAARDFGHPLRIAAAGALADLTIVRSNLLSGSRSDAVRALDGAMRITVVGRHAAAGGVEKDFEHVHEQIKAARKELQDGNPRKAVATLEQAIPVMNAAMAKAGSIEAAVPSQEVWDEYGGATVVNALGVRLGELTAIHARQGAQAPVAELRLGMRDVLGFIDVGGKLIEVPADMLLYGKLQTIGSVLVALPSFEFDAEGIERSLTEKGAGAG